MDKDIKKLKNARSNIRRDLVFSDKDGDRLKDTNVKGVKNLLKDDQDLDKVDEILRSVKRKINPFSGSERLAELLNIMAEKEKKSKKTKGKDKLIDMNKVLQNENSLSMANALLQEENTRTSLYDNYKLITSVISQASEGLKTFVDNIFSPDDFTKVSVSLKYSGTVKDKKKTDIVEENLKEIEKRYNFSDKMISAVENSLLNGDSFLMVAPLGSEIKKLMTNNRTVMEQAESKLESSIISSDEMNSSMRMTMLNENSTTIDVDQSEELLELFSHFADDPKNNSFKKDKNTKKITYNGKPITEKTIKKDIADFVNDKIEITNDTSVLVEEIEDYSRDFLEFSQPLNESDKGSWRTHIDPKKRDKVDEPINVSGSVLKELDPRRVVKLWSNGYCFGYLYVEVREEAKGVLDGKNALVTQRHDTFSQRGNMFSSFSLSDTSVNSKENLIHKMFVHNILRRLNKSSIENNSEFKNAIYQILQHEDLRQNKVRVVYLSPDEVVHFKDNLDKEYGKSLFSDVLFSSKIYIAVLTSMFMMKIVRGPDKRAFYVDAGLSNNQEEMVEAIIREIKTRELNFSDFDDVHNVLRYIGQFENYFFPTFNGERPIDMETIEGQNVDIRDEFLQFLLENVVAGMGIPQQMIGRIEEIEIARSLTMLNGKFLRRVIRKQAVFKEHITKVLRFLYRNEFMFNIQDKKDEEDVNEINLNHIEAILPSPASLNQTNMSEQIRTATEIAEDMVDIIMGDDGGSEDDAYTYDELRKEFKMKILEDIAPSIDWKNFKDLLVRSKADLLAEYILKNKKKKEESSSSSGGSGSSDYGSDNNLSDYGIDEPTAGEEGGSEETKTDDDQFKL